MIFDMIKIIHTNSPNHILPFQQKNQQFLKLHLPNIFSLFRQCFFRITNSGIFRNFIPLSWYPGSFIY
jgi:hypothetical protein